MKFLILFLILFAFNAHAFIATPTELSLINKIRTKQKLERSEVKSYINIIYRFLETRKINEKYNIAFLYKDKCRGTIIEKINNKILGKC